MLIDLILLLPASGLLAPVYRKLKALVLVVCHSPVEVLLTNSQIHEFSYAMREEEHRNRVAGQLIYLLCIHRQIHQYQQKLHQNQHQVYG